MSAHRQHYFEANATRPLAPHPMETRIGEAIAITLLVVVALGAAVSYVVGHEAERAPVVTPVRSPVVQFYELPPLEAAEARTEGFRAGYDTALQQGCSAAFSTPLATR